MDSSIEALDVFVQPQKRPIQLTEPPIQVPPLVVAKRDRAKRCDKG